MAEYITKKAAKGAINHNYPGFWAAIDALPTADVAPVVHGRWVPFHSEVAGDIQYCSACEIGNAAKSDFCPHCGTKMDGGVEDAAD